MTRSNFLKALTALPFLCSFRSQKLSAIEVPMKNTRGNSKSLDLSLLLKAIAQVESGNDDTKIGKAGERSRFQLMESVWIQHTRHRPFTQRNFTTLCKGRDAIYVAWEHVLWLNNNIPWNTDLESIYRDLAISEAWSVGLDAYLRNQIPLAKRNHATRISNLYNDLVRNRPQ